MGLCHPENPAANSIIKERYVLRVIFVYTDNRSPSVATVDNVVKLEDTVEASTNKPIWKTTTASSQEYTLYKENGQIAVLWE